MNRTFLIITGIVILLIPVLFYINFWRLKLVEGHSTTFEFKEENHSFFKEEKRKYILKDMAVKIKSKYETLNSFHYLSPTDTLYITIIQIDELKNKQVSKVEIEEKEDLSNVKFDSGEIFPAKGDCRITVKYHPEYNGTFRVCFNEKCNILKEGNDNNYKWFYGLISRMAFSDDQGNIQTLITCKGKLKKIACLMIEKKGIFYIVLIESINNTFDESVIDIFDLSS